MDKQYVDAVKFVYTYAGHIDDWVTIKKELLKNLPSDARQTFSTRHPITKKQSMNDFEKQIATLWSELTKRSIIFNE